MLAGSLHRRSATRSLHAGPSLRGPTHAASVPGIRRAQRSGVSVHAVVSGKTREAFRTFINPVGQVLTEAGPGVWKADRPFRWFGIDVGGCSALIKLSDGTLWVHSPVGLDPELKAEVESLGKLTHVVTPNFEHTKFAPQWVDGFAGAKAYGPPGMAEKKPDVGYRELANEAPPEWNGEIECAFLGYEGLPLINKPFFNELIFLHKPSKTLITTDFFWNYPGKGVEPGTRAFKFGMDDLYRPVYNNLLIRDRGLFDRTMDRIFNQWAFDRILPCHGNLVEQGGKAALRKALDLRF